MNVLPSCCFPSAHWLKIAGTDAVIDIHENYVKQTFRNRFEIAGVNGRILLTIPVEGQKGQKIPTHEIKIAKGTWQKQHLRSIRAAYGRAPFFEHYYPDLESIFLEPADHLAEFNAATIKWVELTGFKIQAPNTQSFVALNPEIKDFRQHFEPTSNWTELPEYPQVFSDRHSFMQNLSSIDLVMNLGPQLNIYLSCDRQ